MKSAWMHPGSQMSQDKNAQIIAGSLRSDGPSSKTRWSLSQKGSALVMVMIFSIVAATLMVIAGRMISDSAKQTKKIEVSGAEAENVARAGLVDAINWFIRKGIVKSGNPIANPPYSYFDDAFINSSNTLSSDTMDSTIGIVNQYALESKSNLWARYEVHRQLNPIGTPTAVSVDPHAVHDVSGEMMMNTTHQDGEGLMWSLESIGYIFKQLDATKAYNQAPNVILSSARMKTAIRKMAVNPPASSAVIATNLSSIRSGSLGRIYGQGNFCASAVNTGSGPVTSGGIFSQAGCVNTTPLADISENFVFGLSGPSDVKSVADFIGTAANPINFSGSYKLAYYEGNVTYDPASTNVLLQKLSNASGVLYVNGNLTILDGTNSFFDGLIYATGAVTIGIACEIQGQIIGRNGVVVGSTSSMTGDNANVYYGSTQMGKAAQFVGTYREIKTSTKLFQNITNP